LLQQFKSVVIVILALAGIAALVTAQWVEAIAIAAVIVVNTAIGFVSEFKAIRSMEALRQMGGQKTRVRRGGKQREVNVEDLVPGDIVLSEKGDLVPADLRLIEGEKLRVNEAALTGESVGANKTTDPVDADASLAERHCMLFKGTSISDGNATSVAVATGTQTELGRISELAQGAESSSTPLQQRLDQLGRYLAYITIGVAIVVAIAGLLAGRDTMLMIETAIALGVAAIPEGLPIVATIALARGMALMAQRNALVNRLTAVETLGATRIIFTDKTGTLTENKMTLDRIATSAGEHKVADVENRESQNDENRNEKEREKLSDVESVLLERVLRIAVLCNGATLGGEGDEEETSGDPTEIALLIAGRNHDMARKKLLEDYPEKRVVDFDPDTMMMATYHDHDDQTYVAVKGAPSAIFDACQSYFDANDKPKSFDEKAQQQWDERVEKLAGQGLRMLAVADKIVDTEDSEIDDAEPYEQLQLVGLVGLLDPPRHEVKDAVNRCQAAGIRVLMVTGDQPTTGRAIGRAVGIGDNEDAPAMHGKDLLPPEEMTEDYKQQVLKTVVFARVSPEQKLNLVDFYQQRGEPVAMTGDGVNDAPALKKADIGIAMGQRGTDAAKQTADMILQDDSFETIVKAVEQGRIIFGNIRKAVVFMLCTNVAEILAVTIASIAGLPLPLRPLQILYLNVVTDVFPALALGVGRGRPEVMHSPPRDKDEPVLTRHHWTAIIAWSIVIAVCVMVALMIAGYIIGYDVPGAVTVSFLTLALGKLWFVFNLRDHDAPRFDNDIVRNGWLWAAIGLCLVLLAAAVYLPILSTVLQTVPPGGTGWIVILALSVLPALIGLFVPGIRFQSGSGKNAKQDVESESGGEKLSPD
jgi:Ca2+-transporting ATPase